MEESGSKTPELETIVQDYYNWGIVGLAFLGEYLAACKEGQQNPDTTNLTDVLTHDRDYLVYDDILGIDIPGQRFLLNIHNIANFIAEILVVPSKTVAEGFYDYRKRLSRMELLFLGPNSANGIGQQMVASVRAKTLRATEEVSEPENVISLEDHLLGEPDTEDSAQHPPGRYEKLDSTGS